MFPKNKILICGPCAAESEFQLFETAKLIKQLINPDFFRAGLWKPRTNPHTFEGLGKSGVFLLKKIETTFEMPVITEVACAKHIEIIENQNFSAYWIGARTVSNPFSIKEIIEATKNKNTKIFIKNPIFPDIDLWTGIIERFLIEGFENIIPVHRGFYPYEKTKLRNVPLWEIPIELKRRFPNLKIICDPSHITGDSNYIEEISQQAINLNFDGLMIESHFNPKIALSDNNQQVTPNQLSQIIENLNPKNTFTDNQGFNMKIENLRKQIDDVDYQIIEKLINRFNLTDEIGKLKKNNSVSTLQIDRWNAILNSRTKYIENEKLREDFLIKFLNLIHDESIRRQNEI
ncbi:MAG: chorismate mutase [Bacteroidales bacterium]|jgi:chorismate mutase|nr:chorismate mutase [Bacteroidales bacterium]